MNGERKGAYCRVPWRVTAGAVFLIVMPVAAAAAQDGVVSQTRLDQRITALTQAIDRIEAQMQQSQRDLADLRRELTDLRSASDGVRGTEGAAPATALADAVASLRENEAMHQSQIATLEQSKVESASKYPVKLTGMILMTGTVNTHGVDVAETPSVALTGAGSTAATVRQTVLGLDANGPHLFGARSFADVRFDFDGTDSSGYSMALLRLRTAHAELDWKHTQGFFALDRPLLNPETPNSLVAVAEPALAWSGSLWAWNPQLGISQDLASFSRGTLRVQGSMIFVADPPSLYTVQQSGAHAQTSTTELSRWPGIQGRVAFEQQEQKNGAHVGASGYFAPHRAVPWPTRFDSWAVATDFRLPEWRSTQFSGDIYSGSALGGLGAGAFKDYASAYAHGEFYLKALDDRGGWVQWQQKPSERLQFNEAFGMDNIPAHQLRPYVTTATPSYYNLARNRTYTANVIYSPSTSLLFSLEYRRIASSYVSSPTQFADVIGIATGYKF